MVFLVRTDCLKVWNSSSTESNFSQDIIAASTLGHFSRSLHSAIIRADCIFYFYELQVFRLMTSNVSLSSSLPCLGEGGNMTSSDKCVNILRWQCVFRSREYVNHTLSDDRPGLDLPSTTVLESGQLTLLL